MSRTMLALAVSVLALSMFVRADHFSVDADPAIDFARFKPFSIHPGKITSSRPELDNPLFAKMIERVIRATLVGKALKETNDQPDVVVGFSVASEDVSTSERGIPIPAGQGGRGGGRMESSGPRSVRFTAATLVIDMTARGGTDAIWRGVYRDEETAGSKLVQKMPADARQLILGYPPKKK